MFLILLEYCAPVWHYGLDSVQTQSQWLEAIQNAIQYKSAQFTLSMGIFSWNALLLYSLSNGS